MAEKVLIHAEWDIKGAVDLFNLAKNDDELKDMFQLEDEYKLDASGKSLCFRTSFITNNSVQYLIYYIHL